MIPVQRYWEDLDILQVNREEARAANIPYADLKAASAGKRGQSPFYQTLNESWKFRYCESLSLVKEAFYEEDADVREWDNLIVSSC